jgi:hypothetical protein
MDHETRKKRGALSRNVVARHLAKAAPEPTPAPAPAPILDPDELRRLDAAVVRYVMGVGKPRGP